MGGGRGGLCSDHPVLQRARIPASLGLRGSEAHAAAEKRTECAMGLRSALGGRKQSRSVLRFVSRNVLALLFRCDGYPSKIASRRRS